MRTALVEGVRLLDGLRMSEVVRFPSTTAPPDTPVSVREVRHWLQGRLAGTHVDLGDVKVIAAEIGTNAILHTASGAEGGCLWLAVCVTRDRVCLEFTDDGGSSTVPNVNAHPDENGRGLRLVKALSCAWGWDRHADGRTTVRVELPRSRPPKTQNQNLTMGP
ncbi:ATP-binding protein [Thermomonospora umbrina]|uniref:Anti-sigma regulatory factor (Ser/Thr protein kinase) n=1 Tax=Thermomonospora umbrina TaxID=111806 RepID=A0A3D9SKS3_9ACTN|nr:ATP-binding protein [Thermomonospora umbrina]REE96307.1 anti-sigma regulatory factor (Ser/Thr protein kinase) [Thermomonospora umbrina]